MEDTRKRLIVNIKRYMRDKRVPIVDILVDESIQPRESLNASKVEEYSENYRDGITMPSIILHEIDGKRWLCDGFTRLAGARMAGEKFINAQIREDSTRGALTVEAVRANSMHGQPLTASEKRAALIKIVSMYRASEMPWTVVEMADIAGYSVSGARKIIEKEFGADIQEIHKTDPLLEAAVAALTEHSRLKALEDPDAPETQDQRLQRIHAERLKQIDPVRGHAKELHQLLRKVTEMLNKMAVSPGGEVIADQFERFEQAKCDLQIAVHFCAWKVCPMCFGEGMICCDGRGWIMDQRGRANYMGDSGHYDKMSSSL